MKPDLEAIRKRLEAAAPLPFHLWAQMDHLGAASFYRNAPADISALLERVEKLEAVMTKGQKWRRSIMTESERAVEALKCPGDSSDLEYEIAQVHRMTCESSLVQALAAFEKGKKGKHIQNEEGIWHWTDWPPDKWTGYCGLGGKVEE